MIFGDSFLNQARPMAMINDGCSLRHVGIRRLGDSRGLIAKRIAVRVVRLNAFDDICGFAESHVKSGTAADLIGVPSA